MTRSTKTRQPTATRLITAGDTHGRSEGDLSPRLLRRYRPLSPAEPVQSPQDLARVALGRMLYYEKRLSSSGAVSCNSCHPLDDYGATHDMTSTGVGGAHGVRNAPTTYNASRHFTQFWDGRAADVEEQAGLPMLNPREMGMPDAEHVERALKAVPGYAPLFRAAFPESADAVSFKNACTAIGTFERGLITPSRWDRYLGGDKTALSASEKTGAHLFANLGCLVCHTGVLIGGVTFEKVGEANPWPNQSDKGRAEVTREQGDEMRFKVPSLRNVARTGPYFHDGSAATLDQAVRMMAHYQLDEELKDDEAQAIVAWLGSLTGELPRAYIVMPELPAP